MESKLQRRIQRYGWDLAAGCYEPLWQAALAPAQARLLEWAALAPGEQVLDVACGTGLLSFAAAQVLGEQGALLGIDLSGKMVEAAKARADHAPTRNLSFTRMDAETLGLPDAGFDAVLCALGLMYMPDPEQALREMRRVLRPGGRVAIAMWSEPAHCGWSAAFSIIDAEVAARCVPCFSGCARTAHWRVRWRKRNSNPSGTAGFPSRWSTPMRSASATLFLQAGRRHWPGRVSTRPRGNACVHGIWRR